MPALILKRTVNSFYFMVLIVFLYSKKYNKGGIFHGEKGIHLLFISNSTDSCIQFFPRNFLNSTIFYLITDFHSTALSF